MWVNVGCRSTPGFENLRRERDRRPPVGRQPVPRAFVEAVFAARPELEGVRDDPEAPPMGRTRDGTSVEACGNLQDPRFQRLPVRKGTALVRCPCADLRASRPPGEVGVRFLGARPGDRAFDPYLPVQGLPPEQESRPGRRRKFRPFPAFVIRMENESPVVEGTEEHHPRRRTPVGTHRRHRHGVWKGLSRKSRLVEPHAKQIEGIGAIDAHRETFLLSGAPLRYVIILSP